MNPEHAREFDRVCPHIIGNPYLPHWPTPKQALALGLHLRHDYSAESIFELLFGGAAGGGKSDFLLMAHAQYAWRYSHYRGLVLRRTFADLDRAGAIMRRAIEWWVARGVHWSDKSKRMTFPNGATVEFGYYQHKNDSRNYQGGEWHCITFDELTHWPDDDAFLWLSSRMRKTVDDPIPLRLLAASNPGEAGHVWVKRRFVGGHDPETGARIKPVSLYLPSKIGDNPHLDREAYVKTLQKLHPKRRQQILDGDWDARDPGDYFRAEWFGNLIEPDFELGPRRRIRWWDFAASEKATAARTAGVLMARLLSGVKVVEHARAFRKTPGSRDSEILRQAQLDGHDVVIGLEIEPGSGGLAQVETLTNKLRLEGFRVTSARPTTRQADLTEEEKFQLAQNPRSMTGKAGRANPVASCLERGHQRRGEGTQHESPYWGQDLGKIVTAQRDGLRMVRGPWNQEYLDELEGFTGDDDGAALCDLVDATSGGHNWLEANPFGRSLAPEDEPEREGGELANVHPEDRSEDTGRDRRTGHYTP